MQGVPLPSALPTAGDLPLETALVRGIEQLGLANVEVRPFSFGISLN
jgi:hypothetical protein